MDGQESDSQPRANGVSRSIWHRPMVRELTPDEVGAIGVVHADDAAHMSRPNDPLSGLNPSQIFYRCVWLSTLSTNAKVALLAICRYFDDVARGSSMSYHQIARDCGFSESTAKRVVKALQDKKNKGERWLNVEVGKGRERPEGRENLYHGVCPPGLVERLREIEWAKPGVSPRYPCKREDTGEGCHADTPGKDKGCQADPLGVSQRHRESRSHLKGSRSFDASDADARRSRPATLHPFVSEDALDAVRSIAPGWDRQSLHSKFLAWPGSRKAIDMDAAFKGWVRSFTKGKPPK